MHRDQRSGALHRGWYAYYIRELDDSEAPVAADGFRLRTVCVLEAPDGSFAAYVLCFRRHTRVVELRLG